MITSFNRITSKRLSHQIGKDMCEYYLHTTVDGRPVLVRFKDYCQHKWASMSTENICSFLSSAGATAVYVLSVPSPATIPVMCLYTIGSCAVTTVAEYAGKNIGKTIIKPKLLDTRDRIIHRMNHVYDGVPPPDENSTIMGDLSNIRAEYDPSSQSPSKNDGRDDGDDDNDGKNTYQCNICYNTNSDAAFACGHTLCRECGEKTLSTTRKCPFCNERVSKIIKLYM